MTLKICALSDIHGTLLPVEDYFEPCDLVCICGDISPLNIQANDRKMKRWLLDKFKPWCESLPCDKVYFIAGNHDWGAQINPQFLFDHFTKEDKVTYLFHESDTYVSKEGKEYKIFGTPYCKQFFNWAFMEDDDKLIELYKDIPENIDILLTHDQPYQYGDILLQQGYYTGDHIGNKPLLNAIIEKKPHLQINGHLHSCSHDLIMIGDTKHYNVSIKDEKYNPVYDPLIIKI